MPALSVALAELSAFEAKTCKTHSQVAIDYAWLFRVGAIMHQTNNCFVSYVLHNKRLLTPLQSRAEFQVSMAFRKLPWKMTALSDGGQ